MSLTFEWDEEKAQTNLKKHQVGFEDGGFMKKEYNFKGGVRGKHYKSYRKGHMVRVYKTNGTIQTNYFTLEDGAVMLDPDIYQYFSTSESVNKALRSLVTSTH